MYATIIENPPCIVFDLGHGVFATDDPSSGREGIALKGGEGESTTS
jgi:hypothetical protein